MDSPLLVSSAYAYNARYAWLVGLGCVLFLGAILAAIAMAMAAVGAVIFLASAARRSKLGMIAGGAIGAAGAVVAIGALLFIAGWLFWGIWPHDTTSRTAYKHAFGVPAAEVTAIRSRTTSSTHRQFLRFNAPPPTVAALTRSRFKRSTVEDCREQSLHWKDDAPEWWTPAASSQAECYIAEPLDDRLTSNEAWLLYDPATGEARFHYSGVE